MSNNSIDIAGIRKDYMLAELNEDLAGNEPVLFFKQWFGEAEAAQISEINAMTLATVDDQNRPHARIVLLKGLEEGGFVFFTNYDSDKGLEIRGNPNVALTFFWKELERQVRIEGIATKIPETDSDIYFNSRPAGSRIGAWASPQSREIPHRHIIELNYQKYQEEFSQIEIPRPPHWGGYLVTPVSMEFWQGRSSRMHDRILFTQNENSWVKARLAP